MNAVGLGDSARAGVFHLSVDAREFARVAAAAGLMVVYVDIGHAHDREDFVAEASRTMRFPERYGADQSAFAEGLRDLSWMAAKGWAVVLEKSKHFCGGHGGEFKKAMEVMAAAAAHWHAQGKPFWTLISGPEGWKSGWPDLPSS